MKKIYNSPIIKVVEIKSQTILAGSNYDTSDANSMDLGSFGARRRGSDFDDDWEDDEDFE